MQTLTDTLSSMKNMQKENNDLHKQVLQLTRENLDMQNSSMSQPGSSARGGSFRVKPKRPIIDADLDDIGWTIFQDSWSRYKKLSGLQEEADICLELREACSAEVNKLLYDFVGATELNDVNLTESVLMNHIKSVAVRTIHEEVHRWTFNGLTQDEGESVARFVGRLKAQASLCKFMVTCNCNREVSYAEEMISQRLVVGLANPEHQSKVLTEAKDLDTLKKKVDRIMTLETTEDAADKIRHPPARAGPAKSQYKRGQRFPDKQSRFNSPHSSPFNSPSPQFQDI